MENEAKVMANIFIKMACDHRREYKSMVALIMTCNYPPIVA